MEIRLENLGKKFINTWIFKDLNYHFEANKTYAITGRNGSGKSTLASVISGVLSPNAGLVNYQHDKTPVPVEDIFRYLSFAAPYIELVEEFSLEEFLLFHTSFKPFEEISIKGFIELLNLKSSSEKQLKYFSSGMKQRVKLGISFYSRSSFIILDEPTTNLDVSGIEWYHREMEKIIRTKLILICSNQQNEYNFCDEILNLDNF